MALDPDRLRVRVTNDGIFVEVGGGVFSPSIEQARSLADHIEADPDHYSLGSYPKVAKALCKALRDAADVKQALLLGTFRPEGKDGLAS